MTATAAPEQLTLDLHPYQAPTYTPAMTLQEKYVAWRDLNAWVIPALAALLDDWSDHGGQRTSAKAAVEWLRYHHTRRTAGDPFEFNNSFTSRLARDLIARYPHLSSVLVTRELRTL